MDRTRYTRPGIQKPSQTPKQTLGSSQHPVPKVVSLRSMDGFVWPSKMPVGQKPLHVLRPIMDQPQQNPVQPQQKPVQAQHIQRDTKSALPQQRSSYLPLMTQQFDQAEQPPNFDMELPGQESPSTLIRLQKFKWHKVRRGASRGVAVALVLLITMGGMLFSQSYFKIHKVFKGSTGTAAALKENVNPDLLKGEGSGRINILLLGRGGGNHDGPDLTDTMMLASIDPVNHTSTLVSLPRDLWVNVPDHGNMKLNAAWETGEFKYIGKIAPGSTDPKAIQAGFDLVDQTVGGVLGVSINYNLMVDFQAFKQAVDTVGGVSINVPTDLVDPTMAWENDNNPILAKAGVQDFDGKHALIYARSRETTSDFARAERQRSLLVALKGKVATLGTLSNPMKLSGLINSFGDNIQTDLSVKDATRLYSITKGISDTKVASASLADTSNPLVTTGNMNGQSVVLPKSGLFKYDDIQLFIRGLLKDPYIMKENASVLVLNGSPHVGLATLLANDLKTYGYNVTGVANTPSADWTSTTLIDLTHRDKYTKNYLEQRFNQKALTTLSDKSIPTNGADFVIIIGSDEANLTQP